MYKQGQQSPWHNSFLLKTMALLIISGFIEGYDLGVATIGNLYI